VEADSGAHNRCAPFTPGLLPEIQNNTAGHLRNTTKLLIGPKIGCPSPWLGNFRPPHLLPRAAEEKRVNGPARTLAFFHHELLLCADARASSGASFWHVLHCVAISHFDNERIYYKMNGHLAFSLSKLPRRRLFTVVFAPTFGISRSLIEKICQAEFNSLFA
jgi:hypothetical protein